MLETALFEDERILREGDILEVAKKFAIPSPLKYRLELLEPVRQGVARRGTTNILLLSSFDSTASLAPSVDDEPSQGTMSLDFDSQDAIEIDEGFLASSLFGPTYETPSLLGDYDTLHETQDRYESSLGRRFTSRSLRAPCSPSDDHCTLYVRTTDLGKIGILSGDWAIAYAKVSNPRLVRIEANDNVVISPGIACGSPLFLHNTFADQSETPFLMSPAIYIRPSTFGFLGPTIPTARTVTVARVASPLSTNRQYQPLFINSLKAYFDSGKRLVKQGDLLAVAIDTDFSRLNPDKDIGSHGLLPESSHTRPNEVVFFKVTNVEYDVVARSNQSISNGSMLGELGCWVDTSVTRMIQTGLEHSRVPGINSTAINAYSNLAMYDNPYLLRPHSPFSRIYAMASASLSQRAVDYDLHLSFLLTGGRGIGKFTVASWIAESLGLHLFELDCYNILSDSDTKTEATLRVRIEQAKECTPCLLVLRNLEAFSQTTQAAEFRKAEPQVIATLKECFGELQSNWRLTGYPVVILGTTADRDRVPSSLLSCFKHDVDFEAPQEGERLEILQCLLANEMVASDVSLQNLATQTAALLAGDLRDLVIRAKSASIARAIQTDDLNCGSPVQIPIMAADFEIALSKARESYSESIGAPKIPAVSWDDVGGLGHVKSDILDTIQLPLEHPELFADGLKKRSGILLYGPPGTGKTLIAKAVATSFSLNFFSVKGPELLNMYIGESEANVRRVFQRARDAKPCVIFFDELDSVAPKRGSHGDSGGVMDRIVSQLLAELDGMSGGSGGADVFVIGATNRPDLLDPALLRPGRFDRLLYLGVSDTHEAQLNILDALTRKFRLDPDLDLRTIAEQCPFNYTGADFYALCSDAMLNAMSRKAEELNPALMNEQPGLHSHPHPITPQYYLAELASPDDILVYVSERDFRMALNALIPSVSPAEMKHYAEVQQRFSQHKEEETQVQLD
ncbi:AAA-domain-containing protein [Gymnopilus junonius]|uniref:Peroxisomal ATPase PEX6 n=1 Tax=Gymnopilus junonius TaxID=109634 RepID=A0A9P5NBB4_GYMJU|nr:AAA-domain-containing protein [Gymnopilus junonius]